MRTALRARAPVGGKSSAAVPIDRRRGVPRQVYQVLREKILTVQLKPGESINERWLADWLGVSRTPIREAINRLSAHGLIAIVPNVGTSVSLINVGRVKEFCLIRMSLESLIVRHAAESVGATHESRFERGYPALINSDREKRLAVSVAEQIVGAPGVESNMKPVMGAEDFAFMLRSIPGCYVFLDTGPGDGASVCSIHNPRYDFNDDVIPIGTSYWVRLAETALRG